ARDLRDELSDMIGIADSACERIVSAVSLANALRVAGADAGEAGEAETTGDDTPATREAA
uniref:hypothetical protein n=1 Tax=Segatella copri TaxID=165179 RepID=UPI001F39C293